jgi:hypothetical protein
MLEERDVLQQRDLLFDCRFGIQKLLYRASFQEMLLYEKRDIFWSQFFIKEALGIDHHDGAFCTETITTCDDDLHLFREAPHHQF